MVEGIGKVLADVGLASVGLSGGKGRRGAGGGP